MLLEWAEVPFEVIASHVDESFPEGLTPEEASIHVALRKAAAVLSGEAYSKRHRGLPILAADTMVVLDGEVIGKPGDRAEAVSILSKLSGRIHRVVTGVALTDGRRETSFCDVTEVEFHPVTSSDISHYVDRYKPYDKAGAYAIQEWIGVVGIRRINGDFYNVMGLPVSRVLASLSDHFR
jgi:septum formation protein